jgi:hypothetical protein
MNRLGYFSAIVLLSCGMAFAQSSAPSTDPSNSDKTSGQIQNGTSPPTGQASSGSAKNPKRKTDASQDAVPDTAIDDQHNSTTSTTDVGAQNDRPSPSSKMGTTGSTPGTADETPKGNKTSTPPGTPTDQQPNSSTNPGTPPPQAMKMNMTPGARAVATHTPDPGTCMNSAALENAQVPSNSMLPRAAAGSGAACE